MQLFIDQGNTRCKLWWLTRQGDPVRELVLHEGDEFHLPDLGVRQVVVGSVASEVARDRLRHALALSCPQAALHWAHVDARIMPTRYRQPERLGVDRWLAALASREPGMPVLVVDAGTALTVDAVDVSGEHLGGYILPGLSLQRQALASRTARVQFPDSDWTALDWGVDTAGAVGHGSLMAMVALITMAHQRLTTREGQVARLVLTGGDATILQPWLPEAHHHPQLLLQGLRRFLAARESETGRDS